MTSGCSSPPPTSNREATSTGSSPPQATPPCSPAPPTGAKTGGVSKTRYPMWTPILAGTDRFTAEVIAAAPRLAVFGRCGVGYDNIDVAAATRRGVAVTYTPGVNRESVAELVLGQLVNGARLLPQNIAAVQGGRWDQPGGTELAGSVLGIVGLGSIGKAVAKVARALGMTVIAHDPYFDAGFAERHDIEEGTLDRVLAAADFLTLHLFLDDTTRNLIDRDRIAAMKPGSFIVNTARGGVLDEAALADAVREGRLSGAALDVLETEPMAPDNPLRGLDRVFVTAHIGAATRQARGTIEPHGGQAGRGLPRREPRTGQPRQPRVPEGSGLVSALRFDANLKWLFTEHDFLDRFAAAAAAGFTPSSIPTRTGIPQPSCGSGWTTTDSIRFSSTRRWETRAHPSSRASPASPTSCRASRASS